MGEILNGVPQPVCVSPEEFETISELYVKATYFEIIASGTTSGTVSKPAGGGADVSFVMDEWGTATDALVTTMDGGKPTFRSPVDAGGNPITTTFDTDGNFSFSGTPVPSAQHAVVFVYKCFLKNFNADESIFETEIGAGGDHGLLTGLGDDDHTQYLTTGRADTWFTGKDLASLGTKNHNDLDNIQGGSASERYHLTSAQHTELTEVAYSTIETDIDFSASASEDETIAIGAAFKHLVRGRLYIDADPGAGFAAWATLTFYNKAAMTGKDAFFRISCKLVYTELEVATTGSDANITPDDQTDFSPHDLAYIIDNGDSEFIRLTTIADTMVAEDTIAAHDINDGLSRVVEFSGFPLINLESGTDIYARLAFASAQTVSLKLELVVTS